MYEYVICYQCSVIKMNYSNFLLKFEVKFFKVAALNRNCVNRTHNPLLSFVYKINYSFKQALKYPKRNR